ncbi:hypothetical protein BDF20DRAFT_887459 [Mycotypha africana]|uniref:uncharacterized protein n=1 Tax=Mycotypha africana TaxID=64632 RepID=UPI002301A378|nr:uncharacterized protein BDF20DRAFT_887459 [Mycotypha africana]KAI8971954.1 hypothetical protein BDF20DRAFT_887459 [Mycotypha africana]
MYTDSGENSSSSRPRSSSSSLGIKENDLRSRPVSPNHVQDFRFNSRRSASSALNVTDMDSTGVSASKLSRKGLPSPTNAGPSVAALQQRHQWLMQQQQETGNTTSQNIYNMSPRNRAVSPVPNNMKLSEYTDNDRMKPNMSDAVKNGQASDVDVVYEDTIEDYENENVEEERMVILRDTRARSPSIHKGAGGSVMSAQSSSSFHSIPQVINPEFKIVKEGWLYKKNSLTQWKPVYAVAKHGNAVKPGGLYLYKDDKCSSHIQTYDMSEVLEVSPKAQEYRPGIKWEIRMLAKKDNVVLATDDMLTRKDWIDSLTSIMGKVTIATQNALTNRIHSSEQMNRDLQNVAEVLELENSSLKEQLTSLMGSISKKDRLYQQELHNRENELKEAMARKESAFQNELQKREEELSVEMDRQRQALETKCEIFEREAMQWRDKFMALEKKRDITNSDFDGTQQAKIEALENEVRRWENRADELDLQLKQRMHSNQSRHTGSGIRDIDNYGSSSAVKDMIYDINASLQDLHRQIGNSSNASLSDININVSKLCKTLEDAKDGWSELQGDIIKFLENEKEDADLKDAKQKHLFDLLRNDVVHLREEIIGANINEDENNSQVDHIKQVRKAPSLSEKFDILIQMVENMQLSQSRSAASFTGSHSASSISSDDMPSTPPLSFADKGADLYKIVSSHHQELKEWIEESRKMHSFTLNSIEKNLQNHKLPSVPSDISQLHEKITKTIEEAVAEIAKSQEQSQDEQAKNIKVIGNYLQLISNDIQESSIPDLSALSQQLEDVVERLNNTEERLSLLNGPGKWNSSRSDAEDDMTMLNNMPASTNNAALTDDDKLSQLYNFVQNTERFIERSFRILGRYGDNPNAMEETIRRAVKSASKAQLEKILAIQEQNLEEREQIEKKMQRYEENARSYFEKSMSKMHSDLHEYTGVMYEMLESLVLKALGASSPASLIANGENDKDGISEAQKKPIDNVVELYAKLSGLNQILKMEIAKLEKQKEQLETEVKTLTQTNKDIQNEIEHRKLDLKTVETEYERLQHDIRRLRKESANGVAKELEPLILQIEKLKRMATTSDSRRSRIEIMDDLSFIDAEEDLNSQVQIAFIIYY